MDLIFISFIIFLPLQSQCCGIGFVWSGLWAFKFWQYQPSIYTSTLSSLVSVGWAQKSCGTLSKPTRYKNTNLPSNFWISWSKIRPSLPLFLKKKKFVSCLFFWVFLFIVKRKNLLFGEKNLLFDSSWLHEFKNIKNIWN